MRAKILSILSEGPSIFEDLIRNIPEPMRTQIRKPGKWTIHQHCCHLADSQNMMNKRFLRFKTEESPVFLPYLPGKQQSVDYLINLNLAKSLEEFHIKRKEMLSILNSFQENDWIKTGSHPEYRIFTPEIFLRHIMFHDYIHMYRIEELWLTVDEYL